MSAIEFDNCRIVGCISHSNFNAAVKTHDYSIQRPNGVVSSYSYDPTGRLERLTHINGGNQAIEDYHYGYNVDSELTNVTSILSQQQLPSSKNAGAGFFGFDLDVSPLDTLFGLASTSHCQQQEYRSGVKGERLVRF